MGKLYICFYHSIRFVKSSYVQHPRIHVPRQKGNLQDAINVNSINGTHFSEREMLRLFKGTCEAVRAMHDFRAPLAAAPNRRPSHENQTATVSSPIRPPSRNINVDNGVSDDEDDQMFPHPEGDAEGGYSYHGPSRQSSTPLMTKNSALDTEIVFDGDEELSRIQQNGVQNGAAPEDTEPVPYAHRDLKPGYVVMLMCDFCLPG